MFPSFGYGIPQTPIYPNIGMPYSSQTYAQNPFNIYQNRSAAPATGYPNMVTIFTQLLRLLVQALIPNLGNNNTSLSGNTGNNGGGTSFSVPMTAASQPNASASASNIGNRAAGALNKALDVVPTYTQAMNELGSAGGGSCGLRAVKGLLDFYGKGNGVSLSKIMQDTPGYTSASGSGEDALQSALAKNGYSGSWEAPSKEKAIQALQQGKPVLFHLQGHYVLATGYDPQKGFYVGDGVKAFASQANASGWVQYETMGSSIGMGSAPIKMFI